MQKLCLIKKNEDFPQIIINSIPAPELIHNKISEQELSPYFKGLEELDAFGVDFIVIVCNTAHLFLNVFQSKIETPILNLREEVKRVLMKEKIKSFLILGTPTTIKKGLYSFEKIKTIEPNEEEIKELSKAIFNFNKGIDKKEQTDKVRKICKKYLDNGAETVVLGCTEFAVMLHKEKIPKINTINVLVDATISQVLKTKSPYYKNDKKRSRSHTIRSKGCVR